MNKIINSISHSALLKEELHNYQKLDGKPELNIITWCKTRWNSLFFAIQRFFEIYPQLQKAIIDSNSKKSASIIQLLSETHLNTLNEIAETLKPVEFATSKLIGSKVNIFTADKIFEFLLCKLEKINSGLSNKLLSSLKNRVTQRRNVACSSILAYFDQADFSSFKHLKFETR